MTMVRRKMKEVDYANREGRRTKRSTRYLTAQRSGAMENQNLACYVMLMKASRY